MQLVCAGPHYIAFARPVSSATTAPPSKRASPTSLNAVNRSKSEPTRLPPRTREEVGLEGSDHPAGDQGLYDQRVLNPCGPAKPANNKCDWAKQEHGPKCRISHDDHFLSGGLITGRSGSGPLLPTSSTVSSAEGRTQTDGCDETGSWWSLRVRSLAPAVGIGGTGSG